MTTITKIYAVLVLLEIAVLFVAVVVCAHLKNKGDHAGSLRVLFFAMLTLVGINVAEIPVQLLSEKSLAGSVPLIIIAGRMAFKLRSEIVNAEEKKK